ncbi:MBL fold metallo-hydrolase [Kribbella sp. NPDC003557]|uniref:MBL fold metallo-hydrolase n=1 Tax=Kribbella sp. NPDC003557 TaxID=3154449 RepID=UPI0033A803A2
MKITHIGGPTAVLNLGGLTFLIDPAFDEPRDYQLPGRVMTKLIGPAIPAAELGPVDVVLVSHDQHKDNLDDAGRALLAGIPTVLSTPDAATRIPGVRGLANWESIDLPRPDGGVITVTGVPALHGPEGAEEVLGVVTGFVLQGAGLPTVYVSGDNASLGLVKEIADRFAPIDVAVLFAGAARTTLLDGANLTLTSQDAVEAARLLDAAVVVPVHTEGWAHFTEGPDQFAAAFAEAGLSDRVKVLAHGVATTLD